MRPKDEPRYGPIRSALLKYQNLSREYKAVIIIGLSLALFATFTWLTASKDERFFIIGDFGVDDEDPKFASNLEDAKQLAQTLLKVAETDGWPRAMFLTGDLAYPTGIQSISDTRIDRVLDRFPLALRNQVEFYATPGNHDCEGSLDAWLGVRKRFPYWALPKGGDAYGESIFPLPSGGRLRLLTVETCTLVCTPLSPNAPSNFRCGGADSANMEKYAKDPKFAQRKRQQLAWMRSVAPKEKGDWIIVLGHWPIFSFRGNGPTRELAFMLEWMRNLRADIYFSGHDHALQYIRGGHSNDPVFLVSGAGGYPLHPVLKADANYEYNTEGSAQLIHAQDSIGFMSLAVNANRALIKFHDINGKVTYKSSLKRRP